MASILIGGVSVDVHLENYAKLKRAWRFVEAAQGASDFVGGMDAIVGVIAVGSLPKPAPDDDRAYDVRLNVRIDEINDALTGSEINALRPFMNELLIESGMVKPPGEALAAATESPSTETSTASSPS